LKDAAGRNGGNRERIFACDLRMATIKTDPRTHDIEHIFFA